MRQMMRWMVLFFLLVAASLLGGCISQTTPDSITPAKNEVKTNDMVFVLPDLSGKEIKFPDDFSGKKVLLVFFSTG